MDAKFFLRYLCRVLSSSATTPTNAILLLQNLPRLIDPSTCWKKMNPNGPNGCSKRSLNHLSVLLPIKLVHPSLFPSPPLALASFKPFQHETTQKRTLTCRNARNTERVPSPNTTSAFSQFWLALTRAMRQRWWRDLAWQLWHLGA